MSGFVLSYRKIWDNPIFKGNAMRVGVWDWMLKSAAWKPTEHIVGAEVITVQRGQLCVSQAQITSATGMSRQPLRTFLNILEKTESISTRPASSATKGKTLITICKYEEYQALADAQKPKSNQRATKEQPTKEQGKKVTRVTNVTQDARAAEILATIVPQQLASDFAEHRRELKKPLTERAAAAMVNKLDGHHDPGAVLTDSIANGWQGIFPEKTKPKFKTIPGGQNDPSHAHTTADAIRIASRMRRSPGANSV